MFECVVRGYLSGSAWKEYQKTGTLAGEPLARGLRESDKFEPPIFSPATKAVTGHDENVTEATVRHALGDALAGQLKDRSLSLYREAQAFAAARGIIIADTKFEFGLDAKGRLVLIDEVLTPDSSRFWPADRYAPGGAQPSFDKQPVRDYLDGIRKAGQWNAEPPPPPLPASVLEDTTRRYRDIYRRLTGRDLEVS
jgi:phosphoribosylaminoimidazole-succinocarboxamide synthase